MAKAVTEGGEAGGAMAPLTFYLKKNGNFNYKYTYIYIYIIFIKKNFGPPISKKKIWPLLSKTFGSVIVQEVIRSLILLCTLSFMVIIEFYAYKQYQLHRKISVSPFYEFKSGNLSLIQHSRNNL